MIKVENVTTWGWGHSIRGMRNPLASWGKSDSYRDENGEFVVGDNDIALMCRLCQAGPEHRKFMRQLFISMDIVAPLYWWKEYDTYKVGTVADSCSTMHTIHKRDFHFEDFSSEHMRQITEDALRDIIRLLNKYRGQYVETGNKDAWWQLIQLLPESYNQMRTVTMTYENAYSMIHQRAGHKLDEWRTFVEILKELPYMKELLDAG